MRRGGFNDLDLSRGEIGNVVAVRARDIDGGGSWGRATDCLLFSWEAARDACRLLGARDFDESATGQGAEPSCADTPAGATWEVCPANAATANDSQQETLWPGPGSQLKASAWGGGVEEGG